MFFEALCIGLMLTTPCVTRTCVVSDVDVHTGEVCVVDISGEESAYYDSTPQNVRVGQFAYVTFDTFGRIVDCSYTLS